MRKACRYSIVSNVFRLHCEPRAFIYYIRATEQHNERRSKGWTRDAENGLPAPKYTLHMTYTIFIKILIEAQTMLVTR